AMPVRTSVPAPSPRSTTSRSLPVNADTRRLVTTRSPGPGATAGWISAAGAESDDHIHHRDARAAGGGDRAGQALQVAGILGETLDDSPLDIHHQQHGRIHRPGELPLIAGSAARGRITVT